MSVVGYCRVSTEMQAKDGISLDTQRQKIEAWAQFNEKPLRGLWTDEGISGKSKAGRPHLQAALGERNRGEGGAEATAVSVSTEWRGKLSADTERLADKCRGRGAAAWSEATVV